MEPKDMTNEELIAQHAEFSGLSERCGTDMKINTALANCYACADELLHRLNEADALRKNNEELRKDKVRLDWLNERKEWNFDINKASYEPYRSRLQIRDAIDASTAKESEASHE